MFVYDLCVDEMSVDEMFVDEMSVDELVYLVTGFPVLCTFFVEVQNVERQSAKIHFVDLKM
jgi:hypothetical protein